MQNIKSNSSLKKWEEKKPLAASEILYIKYGIKSLEVIFVFIANVLSLSRTVVRNTKIEFEIDKIIAWDFRDFLRTRS